MSRRYEVPLHMLYKSFQIILIGIIEWETKLTRMKMMTYRTTMLQEKILNQLITIIL